MINKYYFSFQGKKLAFQDKALGFKKPMTVLTITTIFKGFFHWMGWDRLYGSNGTISNVPS